MGIPLGLGDIALVFALWYVFTMVNIAMADTDLLIVIGTWTLYASSLIWLYIHHFWRNSFYAADRRAAEIVGLSSLIQSLARCRDITMTMTFTKSRNPLFPTINQRIQKLNRIRLAEQI